MALTVVNPATAPVINVRPIKPKNTRRKNLASATTLELILTPPLKRPQTDPDVNQSSSAMVPIR